LISYPVFNTLKDQVASLEDVAAYGDESMLLSVGNGTKKVRVGTAANLFETLGVVPVIGRSFGEDEIGARAERVALLSHASWTQDYGSDTRAVGATIRLSDHPYRIIGVLPETFRFPSLLLGGLVGTEQLGDHAVWVPIGHRGGPGSGRP